MAVFPESLCVDNNIYEELTEEQIDALTDALTIVKHVSVDD